MLSTLLGGGTLCTMAALVLLVISTATDYWMQYRYSGNFANQGLWRFCINRKCHAHTLTVDFWDATRAFMLLSVLSTFVAALLGLGTFTSSTKSRRVRAGGVASLLAGEPRLQPHALGIGPGFLSLLALAVYTGATVHFFGKRYINWRFSWSYILGWMGVILALASGILQLCAYRRKMSELPPPSITSDS
ncbi:lens intrinsic membrane protein 2.2 isoform X1 [Electrophorus electricus]|uniref:lens intrinsic membrane protein 2.2 isoform X1 n=1 Tax=Electrophorus electricus TaxID=8005 RepID=UPI000F0A3C38|nr:lens intrinsic membrane protein 2.2 isoform X1 [Electrophorus electricus]